MHRRGAIMGRRFGHTAILGLILGLSSLVSTAQDVRERPSRPLILAHYMPWFESKPISGHWGWH
jgi:hypothetical protein